MAPPKVQPKKEPACSIRRNVQKNEIRCFEYKRWDINVKIVQIGD